MKAFVVCEVSFLGSTTGHEGERENKFMKSFYFPSESSIFSGFFLLLLLKSNFLQYIGEWRMELNLIYQRDCILLHPLCRL